MPLQTTKDKAILDANIKALLRAGYSREKALAIALHKADTGEDRMRRGRIDATPLPRKTGKPKGYTILGAKRG